MKIQDQRYFNCQKQEYHAASYKEKPCAEIVDKLVIVIEIAMMFIKVVLFALDLILQTQYNVFEDR